MRTTALRRVVAVVPLALLGLLAPSPSGAAGAPAAAATPVAPAAAVPGAAEPTGTVTWTVQPATADGPDGRVSLRHVLDPGATVEDHVTVTNFGDRAATFVVSAGDGTVSDGGDFDVLPGDGSPQDGGAWVRLTPPEGVQADAAGRLTLTLEPTAAVTIPLTITVPADARPGDHPAGVVAELVDDDAGVRLEARVGTRVHLRVAGDIAAGVVADDVRARWEPSWNPFTPGTVHVSYVVRNAGDVRLGARSTARLAGPFGAGAATRTSEVREVLPGRSAAVSAAVPVWPLLRASGRVAVTPLVVGADVVDVPLDDTSVAVAVWTPPWAQLLLLLVLAGAVLLAVRLRRRSARRVQEQIDAALAAAGVAREPAPDASTTGTHGA
ncbi:hypothetical protein [Cellulomonas shaoxiangyii]|uniref:DUF916 domain-containing protein n=1 Tax=Cellulomonas shaoxiangyii TaxID=2566013 RepID=A0A4P7SIH4_9CELL|nr:hypothetical protein [Cellulomonas shaoxiangyii]QCB92243.1 hypothetical protein E5225_00410 [Cellulomonas shaoxiangyii]TGY85945.1 hypothetical protein E5226_04525 [Cellulomonas shaoxiangyii]